MSALPSDAEPTSSTVWPVVIDRVVGRFRAAQLYRIYLDSFAHLRTEAAARQILTPDEFFEEMADPRILKYSVWRSTTEPAALATVTKALDAVVWISPEFYAARHPEQAARSAIHYLGIALVAPGRGEFRLLERLLVELVKPCAAEKGVLAYDICAYNNIRVHFGRRAEAMLHRVGQVQVSVADTQTYYEAVFE